MIVIQSWEPRPEPADCIFKRKMKVEVVEKEREDVAEKRGNNPILLEDEVQKKWRKPSATEENASKDAGDHV